MGENGGKWGGNGEEMGGKGTSCTTQVSLFSPIFPHFPPIFPYFTPFSPIFPHFSPFFLAMGTLWLRLWVQYPPPEPGTSEPCKTCNKPLPRTGVGWGLVLWSVWLLAFGVWASCPYEHPLVALGEPGRGGEEAAAGLLVEGAVAWVFEKPAHQIFSLCAPFNTHEKKHQ